jgi:hypothetical protein
LSERQPLEILCVAAFAAFRFNVTCASTHAISASQSRTNAAITAWRIAVSRL